MKGFLTRLDKAIWLIIFFCISTISYAGTTGKIAGKILDSETGEPIIGANVLVEGTFLGAAADIDGYYYINNVPPGKYKLIFSAVGYRKTIVENVVVKIDLTTNIDVELVSEAVELGEEVVVQAKRPLITKDLTSASATVSSEEIKMLPVENVHQVINLQAGVVGGHFRGGRSNEVAYLVDGMPVNDSYNNSLGVSVENNSVREMEVISGTFNAEYGQAMSGIVNIVTMDGTSEFTGNASFYTGDNLTSHSDLFPNLDKPRAAFKDLQFSFSGPVPLIKNLTFFTTGRYVDDKGYLYGKRVYNVTDDVPLIPNPQNPDLWYPRNTGDNAYVSMNPSESKTFNGKLTYSLPKWKFSYSMFWGDHWNKYYDHSFRQTPDGIMNHYRTNLVHNFQLSFFPTQSTYSTLKFSYNTYKYWGNLYADPFDSRYVDPLQGLPLTNYTFRSGGNQTGRYVRHTKTLIGQWSLTSQVSKEHKIKIGAEARVHNLHDHYREIVNLKEGQVDDNGNLLFELGYREPGTDKNHTYDKYPYEISAYIQDKMEYDIMIINAGIRLDYFNSNTQLPADLRNPLANPNFPGVDENGNLEMVDSEDELQISPRLGVSFPISDQGAIHFSYGHFFQIPSFENLYVNNDYIIEQGVSLRSITGNPNLKSQKTIKYELGLQQVLFPNISVDFSVYYSDIRNLLGMEIINTYEGFKYARFINRDYGNVKGFIVTLDKRYSNFFSAKLDYTYQIAEGNASDPYAVYNDNQSDPPVESEKKVVPLDWDQRSTVNLSFTIGDPSDWNIGLIFSYGSGMPYTEDVKVSKGVRFENGGSKPYTFNCDLRADKKFKIGNFDVNAFLLVYNLFDTKNEYGVYATTGRANSDLDVKYAGKIIGLNTLEEFINNPTMYSAPRHVRVGFSVGF